MLLKTIISKDIIETLKVFISKSTNVMKTVNQIIISIGSFKPAGSMLWI